MAKKKRYVVNKSVTLDVELSAEVSAIAETKGLSDSSVMRRLLAAGLQAYYRDGERLGEDS